MREQAVSAITDGIVDMIGLGRAMVINTQLANAWLKGEGIDPEFPRFERTIPEGMTAWYTMRIVAIGENRENDFDPDLPTALGKYEERDALRCIKWQKKFSQIL